MTETTKAPVAAAQALNAALDQVILGKAEVVRMTLAAFFAGGHVLLEGLPGLGKTMLAKSVAAMTSLQYKRVQFTPDLMPSDITGTHMIEDAALGKQMRFVPGPVFTHFLLADEINRASSKTQAALLEAMSESSVTLFGESRQLEPPFFVLATQNPIDMEGTNPLPEAQLDRFAIKLDVAPSDETSLLRIIRERSRGSDPPLPMLMDRAAVLACQRAVDEIFLPEPIALLIARLTAQASPTPIAPELVRSFVRYGPSPRAAIWLARIARALAFLDGRRGVGFEDVARAVPHVFGHRLILSYAARLDGLEPRALAVQLHEQIEKQLLDADPRAARREASHA